MDLNFTFKIQKIDRECFALAARPGDLRTASDAADQSPLGGGPHFSPNQTMDADMGRAPDLTNK